MLFASSIVLAVNVEAAGRFTNYIMLFTMKKGDKPSFGGASGKRPSVTTAKE